MCESNSAKVKDDDASSRWEPVSKPWSYYLVLVLLLVLSPLILLFSLIYRIVYYCCLKKPVEETEVPDPYKDVRFKRCPVATWAPGFTGPIKSLNEYRCEYYARHAHARLAHMQEGTGVEGHATFPFDEIKSNVSAFKREQP